MEQAAVGIVALELDIERCREVEGLSCGGKSSLDVVGLLGHGQRVDLLQFHTILILDLLLVIGDQGFLLHIAVVERSRRSCTVLVGGHIAVGWVVLADVDGVVRWVVEISGPSENLGWICAIFSG